MTDAKSSKDQLYEIAAAIESRPVMGYWKHMRADKDAAAIRHAADEIERLRAALERYGCHSGFCSVARAIQSGNWNGVTKCDCGFDELRSGVTAVETATQQKVTK